MENMFAKKNILVTGGTGSIGSEIVRRVLQYKPNVVRILSRDEAKQFDQMQEFRDCDNIRFLIGDVRNKDRLTRAFENIDIVFHAAAMKHVPACEYNPFEAVSTNVIGTQNVIDVALENEVEKVIVISTDKAANPINTMGATKFLAEKLVSDTYYFTWHKKTKFSCVRFGNVVGSRGSVIPLFQKQIKKGGPLTVTDQDMTRFIMSIPQAVDLVFKATEISKGGETFILKMPVVKIGDLIRAMVEYYAPKYGYKCSDIGIENIGIRDGEKMHEHLMTEDESQHAYENDDMFIVLPRSVVPDYRQTGVVKTIPGNYSSDKAELLSVEDIKKLLEAEDAIESETI